MTVRNNTLINLGGQLLQMIVLLLTVPTYLRLVGEARYGALLIVWMLLGYFGLFDFGLARAVAQKIANLRDGSPNERATVVWTACAMSGALSIVGAGVLGSFGYIYLKHAINVDGTLRSELLASLPWLVLAVPIMLTASTFLGALEGRGSFLALNCIGSLGAILSQVFPLMIAWRVSASLEWMIPAALCSRLLTGLIGFQCCRNAVPLRGRPVVQLSLLRPLLRYGGWVSVNAIVGPLLVTVDRLIIGMVAGVQAVTHYTVPYGLVARLMTIPGSLASALFPQFAVQSATQNSKLMESSIVVLTSVMTPITVLGLFAMKPFLSIWVSKDFAEGASGIGEIILVGVWANAPAVVPHSRLQAEGRPKVVAMLLLVELLPYYILLWIGLHFFGALGAAAAWTIRVVFDSILHFRAVGINISFLRKLLIPLMVVSVSFAAVQIFPLSATFRWILASILLTSAVALSWLALPEKWRINLSCIFRLSGT